MNSFKERLRDALNGPLPGHEAHREMINYPRPLKNIAEADFPNARRGGVLVLIYPKEDKPHLVLTLRHAYRGVHSAQVSFPGGGREEGDPDLYHTALREASEEVCAVPDRIERIGALSMVYIPPSNFLVSPFVGFCRDTPDFRPEEREVARIIETPLSRLTDSDVIKEKTVYLKLTESEMKVKYFDIDGETVWGATGMMLNELAHILRRIDT